MFLNGLSFEKTKVHKSMGSFDFGIKKNQSAKNFLKMAAK